MVLVTDEPINPATAYDLIGCDNAGSVLFHYAVVKANNDPRRETTSIDYLPNGDVRAELDSIAADLKEKWSLTEVLLVRRTGRLGVGDIISLVAAGSANSVDAFAACQYGIERLKKMSTIKKQEAFR